MLYFNVNELGVVVAVSDKNMPGKGWTSRWDFKTYAHAEHLAASASKLQEGTTFIAIDNGESVSPRFDVIEAPKLGDEVSYGFNGDYYPDGTIVRIGVHMKQILTSTGNRYYRRKLTGRWVQAGGTWTLVQGHRSERNPSF